MYTLAVKRDFIANHYLIGGDWGAENNLHAHHYIIELQLQSETLDQHGYLVDIVNVEMHLDKIVEIYRDKVLNDLEEFNGLNPSIEHFSRILCTRLSDAIKAPNINLVKLIIWENDIAWASYELAR